MSALVQSTLRVQTATSIISWPAKNFPNNAIMTLAGIISLIVLQKIHVSYYYTALLGGLTLVGVKLHQMNKEAKKRLVDEQNIREIKGQISELDGFESNNFKIMNLYLKLGKSSIEHMFNRFNKTEYAKIKLIARYCNIKVLTLTTIWDKHPNFNDVSYRRRRDLLMTQLPADKKREFEKILL